jgi:putative two-component system response regulator
MTERQSGHILVVDDNEAVLKTTVTILQKVGFTVTSCNDSSTALELLGDLEPDLLITDICMPQVTGTQLLDAMQRFGVEIPVILMTGYAEINVVIDAVRKRAFDFIKKPYNPEYLISAASRAVSQRRETLKARLKNPNSAPLPYNLTLRDPLQKKIRTVASEMLMIIDHAKSVEDPNRLKLYLEKLHQLTGTLIRFADERPDEN